MSPLFANCLLELHWELNAPLFLTGGVYLEITLLQAQLFFCLDESK
uniref:Uncharacterized protein n=1 Tax=Anguilla anguilla TaxID=7936 RepID=A0A0E9RLH1_ANGAN